MAAFDKIFKDIPGDWYTKANILANLYKYTEAIKCYDEILFLDTHYTKAWYRKGCILFGLEKYADAVKCFDNVMVLDASNKNAEKSWYLAALILKTVSTIRQSMTHEVAMQDLINGMPQEALQEVAAYLTKVYLKLYVPNFHLFSRSI